MKITPGTYLPEGSFKHWQLGAIFLPFSIPLLEVSLSLSAGGIFSGLSCGIGVMILCLLGLIWVTGLLKAFPTWSLPSLGLILLILAYGIYLVFQAVTLVFLQPLWGSYWPDSILLRLFMYLWFNLVYVAIAAIILITLLVFFPQFLHLARKDWSLLSFLVYSMAIRYTIFYDEYHGLEPYQLVSLLILINGAGLFIILPARWKRLLALLVTTTLALCTVSLGLYMIFPEQAFAESVSSFRMWEALQPVLDLPALLTILCLPLLVRKLPNSFGIKRMDKG